MKVFGIAIALALTFIRPGFAAEPLRDPGWPRVIEEQGATLVIYQPQVDDWRNFRDLDFRLAFTLTPPHEKTVVGIMTAHGQTVVNVDDRNVLIDHLSVTGTNFPSLAGDTAARMDRLTRSLLKPDRSVLISLDRFMASVNKPARGSVVTVKNDPPRIFASYEPTILLQTDGAPVWAKYRDSSLQFLLNANWPVFLDTSTSNYYLFDDTEWLVASSLSGAWAYTRRIPQEMSEVEGDPQWVRLKEAKAFPAPPRGPATPKVVYSEEPAELILFEGPPSYAQIPGTRLAYAANTDSDIFLYGPTSQYYYLVAGRWFRATSLDGPWTFATPELPGDFAQIPASSPASRVLSSVPGTEEAKDSVLLAQVPTTAVIDPAKAAAEVKVVYNGTPEFKPIEGTSLSYATNTGDKVIKVGDLYYLCVQGVWFRSTTASGPWTTAPSVPSEIYTIPPSSPVYNVTYVTQTTLPNGNVQASYTAGYLGTFVAGAAVGAVLASGTGYYYPPTWWYPVGGYPIYHPYAATYGVGSYYNPYTGAYGVGVGVYGPRGAVTAGAVYNPYTGTYARGARAYGPYGSASIGQAYNPYTGTYAQGARTSTGYGSRTVAQAYNPRTGTYAATRQVSTPYGQWGSSVISRGGETVTAAHATTERGSVAGVKTSEGGKAVAGSHGGDSGFAAKTTSGNVYAGHDGNVYRNTNGSWEKYSDGGWTPVEPKGSSVQQRASQKSTAPGVTTRPAGQTTAARKSPRPPTEGVGQDYQKRQRGEELNARYQRSGGGWNGSRSFGGGGFAGGAWGRAGGGGRASRR